jgi:hypothetical protein
MDKKVIISGIVVVLAALGIVFLIPQKQAEQTSEPTSGALTGPLISSPWLSWGGVYDYRVKGSCNTASSTILAIANPWQATSTLVHFSILGTMGATTTDLVVATSTIASPAYTTTTATSSLGENILGAQIAANAQFFSVAGVSLGAGTGYTNPTLNGFVSNRAVGIGPSEYVIGFATSTAAAGAGGRGAGQVSVPSSCTYEAVFIRGS